MDFEVQKDGCRVTPPYSLPEIADFANALLETLQEYHQQKVFYRRNGTGSRQAGELRHNDFFNTNAGEFIMDTRGTLCNLGTLVFYFPTAPVVVRLVGDREYVESIVYGALERFTEPAAVKSNR